MYYLLGICLALAALLAVNALASLTSAVLWRFVRRPARRWSASMRARFLFSLRTLPPMVSLLCGIMLLLPAYVIYEPRHSTEAVGAKLLLLAVPSLIGIVLAAWRGVASWAATRRLVKAWMSKAAPIALDGLLISAYRIEHSFPVVAIVGALRPRLFIAGQLFETLSQEELAAAVRHEMGHLTARDNLKRPLVRACSDVLMLIPCGRSLDRAWKEASEAAADEYTARTQSAEGALALASAIIKIARQIPPGATPTLPAGAFLIAEAGDDIARRVRQLVRLAETERPERPALALAYVTWTLLCAFLASLILLVAQTNLLLRLHVVVEGFVSALQ